VIKKTKFALIAALAILNFSSPVLARSYGVNAAGNGPIVTQHQSRPFSDSARRHGRQLYDMAPSRPPAGNPNSSASTGGGSLGYNQMLLID
jgi:hypothetical protein